MRATGMQAAPEELSGEPLAPERSRVSAWLGPLAGLTLLIATVYYVDQSALRARISQLRAAPILFGAALIVPQLYWLALRWRLTIAQLGLELSPRRALREYALSVLLNQLLPFGVAGDAVRVARHARNSGSGSARRSRQGSAGTACEAAPDPAAVSGIRSLAPLTPGLSSALHGVVLDRLMGQLVVILWALLSLPLWFGAVGLGLCSAALTLLWFLVSVLRRLPGSADPTTRSGALRALLRISHALQQLLANPRYLKSQFVLSSLLVLSIVAQLCCALSALGLSLSAAQATQVFPLMLLSMSVPLSFAGFGPREAVTAELYDVLQLSAADGVAFAIAYGAIVVCSLLPCLLLVLGVRERIAEPA